MRLLYDLTKQMDAKTGSPLELWIKKNDWRTKEKFQYLKEENCFTGPVPFMQESENTKFKVTIDPGQQFNIVDKLSQVSFNALIIWYRYLVYHS
ncbi:hypothetical protein DPMN_033848 [Dreissena polymorpha]|uniref:Uncharacterized protein n=1 Tax=Dreissena polymorpha TaxID=45954 RepID=A0A9D4RJI4_DREPO|nr:hypothetical protein DPMN_033848 [Dreissena polymorpha]